MWKAAKWGLALLAVGLSIALAGVVGHTIGDDGTSSTTITVNGNGGGDAGDYSILQEIEDILHEDFVNPDAVNTDVLIKGAIDGEIKALGDAHTVYIAPEDFALGVDIISGTFQGIGAQVDQDPVTGEIVIVTPFRDSPAEKAGIKAGDVILEVDGESTEGWSVAEAVKRIRGEQGTPVTLMIRSSDGETTREVTVERDTIVIPTVFTREVEGADGAIVPDVAYIELQQFTEETVGDLSDELEKIVDDGYKGVILDLRRNPGGALDATVDVADMFLDDGVVLTQVDRDGHRTDYRAKSGGEALDLKVAILVGPGSASGSEVLSGALRDHGRAKLVGEQTFGKGSVNHIRELSNGGALYVTIARWLTPNGEQIEGVGLAPDIPVTLSDDDVANNRDTQLFAAIDYLHQEFAAQR
ncbi:MAG TPA: S41 family peptidase [Dehalococcoidia bacterium]|nr:S41 family peptidase [Dehalococcoidia bacterium]